MKILSLLLAAICMWGSCKKDIRATPRNSAQIISAANVPSAVIQAFNTNFANASEIEWEQEDDNFICQFNLSRQRQEVEFDDKGSERRRSVISTAGAVPAVVLDGFRKHFDDLVYEWKLTNEQTWKAHFFRNNLKREVTLDSFGNVLKQEHD